MTPNLDSTLSSIDEVAVHHCGQCDAPLSPDSPSALFCSPEHQTEWYEARSQALVGYREPSDVPQHIHNQVELDSPETAPPSPLLAALERMMRPRAEVPAAFISASLSTSLPAEPDRPEHDDVWARTGSITSWDVGEPCRDTSAFAQWIDAPLGLDDWQRLLLNQVYETRHGPDLARALEELDDVDPRQRALDARRNRNTGPRQRQRAPRRIDSRGSR